MVEENLAAPHVLQQYLLKVSFWSCGLALIRQSTFETKTKQLGEYLINMLNFPQLSDANGKAKDALKQTQAQLQRTADELRKSHPEVEQQATALKDKLQSAVENTVQVIYNTFP